MDRRAFLAAAGAIGAAGCTGDSGAKTETPSPTPDGPDRSGLPLGESATLDGNEVSVTDATVARQIGAEDGIFYAFDGVYLLVHTSFVGNNSQ